MTRAVLGVVVLAGGSWAQKTPVINGGFEWPVLADGVFETGVAPLGWEAYGAVDFGFRTVGALNPNGTTLYPGGAPDGNNVGVVFLLDDPEDQGAFAGVEAGLQQGFGIPFSSGLHHRLEVLVGNIANDPEPPHGSFEFEGFPGYRVELLAGEVAVASSTGPAPVEGGWVTAVVTFTAERDHPLLGEELGVRLVNLNAGPGLEVNFDGVTLTADLCATAETAEVVRVGTPPNPAALLPGVTSGPVTGAVWDPLVDHGAFVPGALGDLLILSPSATEVDLGFPGTLLCSVPFLGFTPFNPTPGQPFAIPIPDDCSLIGVSLCAQAVSSADGVSFLFTNALDVTIGGS